MGVTDSRFHHGAPFQPSLDLFRHAAFLPGDNQKVQPAYAARREANTPAARASFAVRA